MENSNKQRISQIKAYCEEIGETVKRFGTDYDTFSEDKDYIKSISMSIMQIGEVSVGLSDEFKEATKNEMEWSLIRGMRNMFAHTYEKMDKIIIWEAATKNIPELLAFCDRIIERNLLENTPRQNNSKPSLLKELEENKKAVSENCGGSRSPEKKDKNEIDI